MASSSGLIDDRNRTDATSATGGRGQPASELSGAPPPALAGRAKSPEVTIVVFLLPSQGGETPESEAACAIPPALSGRRADPVERADVGQLMPDRAVASVEKDRAHDLAVPRGEAYCTVPCRAGRRRPRLPHLLRGWRGDAPITFPARPARCGVIPSATARVLRLLLPLFSRLDCSPVAPQERNSAFGADELC